MTARGRGAPDDLTADRHVEVRDGIRLCYRSDGDPEHEPLLLINGLAEDLTAWPRLFVDALVARGFCVIRHDNRDVGRSTTIDRPAPARWRQLTGRPLPGAYTLEDMALDSLGLLAHLEIDRAHVLGRSMGGMVAQVMAATAPSMVRTLTSLYSTTGSPRVGRARWSTRRRLAARPPTSAAQASARHLDVVRHLAGPGFPVDEDVERAYVAGMWQRAVATGPGGMARQIQAIAASGDRTDQVRMITAPTLVIHGDTDLIVDPSGGRATADAVPGATFVPIAGMGHHLPPGLYEVIADLVAHHCRTTTTAPLPAGWNPALTEDS